MKLTTHFLIFTLLSSILLLVSGCNKLELIPHASLELAVEAKDISFAVIGDYGTSKESTRRVSEMVKSWKPDFIITTGDNNYEKGLLHSLKENVGAYYCDFIYNPDAPEDCRCEGRAAREEQNRFFPSPGNHDYKNKDGNIPYLNYFTLPGHEEYYSFLWGPVQFFSIDSGSRGQGTPEQVLWLKEQAAQSTAPFKIVYFHHSPYSEGKHGNEKSMQWNFADWGINAVLTGHDHIYQRIRKKSEPQLLYLVNGLGGKSRRSCGVKPLDREEFDVFCFDEEYGAMKGVATASSLKLGFYSLDDWDHPIDEVKIAY